MNALSAPGKLFLAGEYAVLDKGRPALVAAVDRALHAEWELLPEDKVELVHEPSGARVNGTLMKGLLLWTGGRDELRFAMRAASMATLLCREEGREARGFRLVFKDELAVTVEGRSLKLGLGGSAAATVLAVRAACAAHGRTNTPEDTLAIACAAHWLEQGGQGSGGDVAASALGGLLELRVQHPWTKAEDVIARPLRALLDQPPLAITRLKAPPDLRLLIAFSGRSASTQNLLGEVCAYEAEAPARYKRILDEITFACEGLRDALRAAHQEHGAYEAVLAAVRRAGVAMAVLGDESGAQIMTPELMHVTALATLNGCAAKPSGAGGGDCAVVVCFGDERRAGMKRLLESYGYPAQVIDIAPKPQ
ncbi:MAG: hypothetical protein JST92_23705 [Deltaproteobacteria bacterium]|nr:hypothetical protein [Deltaproteobacteria bacterium]